MTDPSNLADEAGVSRAHLGTSAASNADDPSGPRPVRVWDWPTRVFHWALALAAVLMVITGRVGGNALVWHMRLGLAVLALLVFRLLWGVLGGRWSRFAQFVRGPATVWRYLRGPHQAGDHFEVGHNPLGAGAVLAMLAVQVATGLVADDEIATTGPLNKWVTTATGLAASAWHTGWGQWGLVGLVSLHMAAIGVYRWRGTNLVRPMLTGDKRLPADVPASADHGRSHALALLLAVLCGGLAWWVGRLGG